MLQNNAFYCKIILRIGDYVNRKSLFKALIIFTVAILIVLLSSNIVFATIDTNITIGNKMRNEAAPIGNKIVGAIKVVGIFVSVAMTMIVGIRYMLSSVEEKAEYKKTTIIYLVGILLIFATTQLIDFIYNLIN